MATSGLQVATHIHDLVEHPTDTNLCIGEGVENDVAFELLRPVAFAQLVPRVSIGGVFNEEPDAKLQRIEVSVRLGFAPGLE